MCRDNPAGQSVVEPLQGPAMTLHLEYERQTHMGDFIRVLERDGRDIDGKLLKCGSQVLCHPSEPGTFREDSPGNRQAFLRLDRTWSNAARLRVWFPSLTDLPAEAARRAEQARSERMHSSPRSTRTWRWPKANHSPK